MLKEPVVLSAYDPQWPDRYAALAARARAALGGLPAELAHVGSTAVPGLVAKPIIDLDVIVDPRDVPTALARLATLGYRHEGTKGIPGRESMRWPAGEARHHLYVCHDDARALDDHLRWRDLLRHDAQLAATYAAHKTALAAQFRDQREAYQAGKDDFIARTLAMHRPTRWIRRATSADLPALAALGQATYPAFFAEIWTPAGLAAYVDREYSVATLTAQLADPGLSWWVADEGGTLVGYAKLRHDRPIPGLGVPGVEIDKCYAAAGRTGQGIGAELFAALRRQARRFAPRRCWLGVLGANVGAQRMYAREGFTLVGPMPLATDRGPIDCVVMAEP